jgi:uncharacterized protein (TIGR03435 family)
MKISLVCLLILAVAFAASGQDTSVQPKFEAASVKRADRCGGGGSMDQAAVALRGVPLKGVLMEAFKVKMDQIEGPSWLETECFDISAKIPAGASLNQLPAMLQALLTERFGLAAHKFDRMRSGYALVVDKGGPKCKQDDPNADFMGRNRGMTLYGAFGHGALKGVMSMAILASNLSKVGYGPVEDHTGLPGKYDIDLRWTPNAEFERNGSGVTLPASDAWPEADLFTAIRESLGLKLERRDVQVQFVVIDHIERIPTEN